ncbi:Os09g0441250, partial [Oryza sativa Japonica Group]
HIDTSGPGIEVGRQLGLNDDLERNLPRRGQAEDLLHAQLAGRHAVGEPPLEAVQQAGEAQLYHLQPEAVAGAQPAAGPERQQLEVLSLHVDLAADEPLRHELLRRVPQRRVAGDGPHVDEHPRSGGDVVAADGGVLAGYVRRQQGRHRVHAHRLLHDGLHVGEAGHVRLGDQAAAADDAVQLLGRLGEDLRLPQELRNGPLHGDGGGVRAAGDQVLHHIWKS